MNEADAVLGALRPEPTEIAAFLRRRPYLNHAYCAERIAVGMGAVAAGPLGSHVDVFLGSVYLKMGTGMTSGGVDGFNFTLAETWRADGEHDKHRRDYVQVHIPRTAITAVIASLRSMFDGQQE